MAMPQASGISDLSQHNQPKEQNANFINKNSERIPLTRCPNLCLISNTPKGRGIFATSAIPSGTTLDTSPILLLPPNENKDHVEHTILYHYTYNWPTTSPTTGKPTKSQAVVLGLGSMFNHSRREQNVGWTRDLGNEVIVYSALKDIEEGEELCISYGDHLTFEDVDGDGEDRGREGEGMEEDVGGELGSIEIDLLV